jgi:hypothetical protein
LYFSVYCKNVVNEQQSKWNKKDENKFYPIEGETKERSAKDVNSEGLG